jgi:hypothetical protein
MSVSTSPLVTCSLLAACVFVACASHMQRISPAEGPAPGDKSRGSASAASMSIQVMGCLGSCPVYSLDIYRDGLVTYEGKLGVCAIGKRTKRIAPATVAAFEAKWHEYGIDKLDERCCTCPMSDVPSTLVTARLPNGDKTIVHTAYCPAPRSISEFEAYIDSAIRVEDWIGTAAQRRKCSNSF